MKNASSRFARADVSPAVSPTISDATRTENCSPRSSTWQPPACRACVTYSAAVRSMNARCRSSSARGLKNRTSCLRCSVCPGPSSIRIGRRAKNREGIRSAVNPACDVASFARSTAWLSRRFRKRMTSWVTRSSLVLPRRLRIDGSLHSGCPCPVPVGQLSDRTQYVRWALCVLKIDKRAPKTSRGILCRFAERFIAHCPL